MRERRRWLSGSKGVNDGSSQTLHFPKGHTHVHYGTPDTTCDRKTKQVHMDESTMLCMFYEYNVAGAHDFPATCFSGNAMLHLFDMLS